MFVGSYFSVLKILTRGNNFKPACLGKTSSIKESHIILQIPQSVSGKGWKSTVLFSTFGKDRRHLVSDFILPYISLCVNERQIPRFTPMDRICPRSFRMQLRNWFSTSASHMTSGRAEVSLGRCVLSKTHTVITQHLESSVSQLWIPKGLLEQCLITSYSRPEV